jgi:hypothetical protein
MIGETSCVLVIGENLKSAPAGVTRLPSAGEAWSIQTSRHWVAPCAAVAPILRPMFEAIFVGMSLFEAAVWFLGGLLLGGIGFAFFVDSILFR